MNSRVSPRDKLAIMSDLVIIVNNVEFKVHRVILSMESDVFYAMFSSNWTERDSGRVEINDVDPEVFDEFLHFIYTKTSPKLSRFPIQLMELADKYMVHHLLDLCEEFLKANVDVLNVCDSLIAAHRLNRDDLNNNLFEFVGNHLSEIVKRDDWQKVEADFNLMTKLSRSFPERPQPKIDPSPVVCSEGIRAATWTPWETHHGYLKDSYSPTFTLPTTSGVLNFRLHKTWSASTFSVHFITLSEPQTLPVFLSCQIVVLDRCGAVIFSSSVRGNLWTMVGDDINFEICDGFINHEEATICVDVIKMKEVPLAKSRFMEKDQLSEYFDVSFRINSRVFNGHRAILAGKSQFFYDLFKNPDRVAEPHYVLTETTEEAFEIIINYLYTDEFPPTELTNLELLKCAHLFVLPDLKTQLELHCENNVKIENAIPSLIGAHQVNSEKIKAKAVDIISTIPKNLVNYEERWSQLSPFPQLITPILIRLRENLE